MIRNRISLPAGPVAHGFVILCGAGFAGLMYPLTTLQPRWMLASIAAIVLVSTALVFIARLPDLLMAALFFAIPLAGIAKHYFPSSVAEEERGNVFYSGTLSLGLLDVVLAGLFLCWLARRFARRQRPTRLVGLDWLILLVVAAHALSLLRAPVLVLGVLATLHLAKHVLLYLYVSRNMRPKHFDWFLAMMALAIVLQTGLGAVQTASGGQLIGLARDKGAGGDALGSQYAVAKLEHIARAEGTLMDSHELGALFAMLLPMALSIVVAPEVRRSARMVALLIFAIGIVGLGLTFSRSAILGLTIALFVFAFMYMLNWPSRTQASVCLMLIVCIVLAVLVAAPVIGARYTSQSIADAMDLRMQQYELAMRIWRMSPLIGYGAGNYMHAAKVFGNEFTELLPVHNMSLWILADTGVIGAAAFHGVLLAALRRYWLLMRIRSGLVPRLALGGFTGLVACFCDSLTDPALRGPTLFPLFWTFIALSVSLVSLLDEPDRVGWRLLRA